MPEDKVYLGDGVYAEFSSYDVRLSTEREITHEIFLEDNMVELLYKKLKEKREAQ